MEVLRRLRTRRVVLTPRPVRAVLTGLMFVALASPSVRCGAQLPAGATAAADTRWPVKSREHVDLWLHAFAVISDDSARVPLFRRGYVDAMTVEKNKAGMVTDLDANREALARRLRANPALVNAQFIALYFPSWVELEAAMDLFVKADGSARTARSQQEAGVIAMLGGVFPAREDREFARRLLIALRSERDKFYHAWWLVETRRRDATFEAVDTLWRRTYLPALQQFLNHTQQGNGEVILALALDGEGRTVSGGKLHTSIAVGFPDSPSQAMDAIYAIAHEIVGSLTGAAVADNTTPAEKRSGAAQRLSSVALVRAGELLLAHLSKPLADGYARFYLQAAGVAIEGDAIAAFARAFPVPQGMLDSIERQIGIAFGGI